MGPWAGTRTIISTAPVQVRQAHTPAASGRSITRRASTTQGEPWPPVSLPGPGSAARSGAGRRRGSQAARGPSRPPVPKPGGKRSSAAAVLTQLGSGQCQAHPWQLCAFHPWRARAVAFRQARSHQRSAGAPCATRVCPQYSDADQAAAPAFVPGGKPPRAARLRLQKAGRKIKKEAFGPSSRPGPPREPALCPNEPLSSAGFGFDASREFACPRAQTGLRRAVPGALGPLATCR